MVNDLEDRFNAVDQSETFNRILNAFDLRNKKVLDLGCGYGEYLAKFGKDSFGITTTLEEVENGKLKGLRIIFGNVELIDSLEIERGFKAVWANNLIEHLLSPHSFLIKLKKICERETLLVLGVPVIPRIQSLLRLKKFKGALAISHVNFFTRESLKLTVERAGWKVEDIRPFIFTNKILDKAASFFVPHLYVVAVNDKNFQYSDKKLKEWKDEPFYSKLIS